jgi:hypothetical protein
MKNGIKPQRTHRLFTLTILVIAFSSLVIPVANAYIDPGSGSYIFQMVVGAFLGISLAVKVFWHKITGFFTGRNRSTDKEEQQSSPK